MAHALNNASHTSACAELGISVGTDRTQTSLTRHASINKWSFYRPGSIAPNASDYVTLTAPSNNDKLGDFRGYNHSAFEPYPFDVYPTGKNWGPGGTVISLTFQVYVEELNLRELFSGSVPYITIRYYMSSSNRSSQTSHVRTYTTTASETSNTPPTGHTNNQTQRPASASQIITDANFPTSLLSTPDDTIYCDLYFSDISGNQVVRFGSVLADGHVDINTHEVANPFVDACASNITPPSGYTFAFPVVTNSSSGKNGVDFTESNGSSTYGTFYWYVVGFRSSDSTYRRLGSVSATANLVIKNPEGGTTQNTTQIFNSTLNAAGASSNQSASGTLSSSYTWVWDDVGDVEVTVPSWTGFTSYSLGTTAPTCT